ncbi:MAG: hypothetical protein EXR29_10675 [Betaproteobacteria bacterium]|nr:hypothetical protein [Betaproteobacteria bacterium]
MTTTRAPFKLNRWCLIGMLACGAVVNLPQALAAGEGGKTEMSPAATAVPHKDDGFGPDPSYESKPYSEEDQLKIYGGKTQVHTPRPLLELGRPIYQNGPLQPSTSGMGEKNPVYHAFSIYGDWRTGVATNVNGGTRTSVLATRLNLDVDWKFTATERVHAFFRPLDRNGEFTRCEFQNGRTNNCTAKVDIKADALFFEGDLAAMVAGWTGAYQKFDLAFAAGKMPLLFQNGIWMEDAITGAAVSLPGKNSATFGISNMDVTFFAGMNSVNTPGVVDRFGVPASSNVRVYGATAFIEANQGYWEVGYAYTDPQRELSNQHYNNLGLAFTRRYGGWLSNSVRLIHTYGQELPGGARPTANGTLLLVENSFVTSKPSTLVPYLNMFVGSGKPQSVARAVDAGGILKNTGINFETDGLTGFPKLNDTGNNTYGGALGVSYLFNLDQQLVFELATTQTRKDLASRTLVGREIGLGVRYQRPLDKAWIFRADAMIADRANTKDLAGVRLELRRKF